MEHLVEPCIPTPRKIDVKENEPTHHSPNTKTMYYIIYSKQSTIIKSKTDKPDLTRGNFLIILRYYRNPVYFLFYLKASTCNIKRDILVRTGINILNLSRSCCNNIPFHIWINIYDL